MKPSVKLISVCDNRERAWKYSRPGFDHSNLDMENIGSMDMSLNSLCTLTFEITSSIMFRDFLFSIRPISAWARSSRSAPLTKSNLSLSDEFHDWGSSGIDKTLKLIEQGVPQDKAREHLPMTLSTSYTISMDFRTVCGLLKTMVYMGKDLYNIYGIQFENEIEHISGFKSNKVKDFYNNYALTECEMESSKLTRVGDMRYGSYLMKAALASQFIRQSRSIVKTNIWNMISWKGYLMASKIYQHNLIRVSFYSSVKAYDNLMRLRSHWFADWSNDMWGSIVGEYVKDMSVEEFWNFIPNGNGKADPYYRDMLSRVNGEEHNLPCPIMLEYPDLIYQRLHEQGENPIIHKYINFVELGLIKDNPNNELRKAYVARIK